MLTVKGIFDGRKIQLLEDISINKPTKVLVTFLEDGFETEISNEDIRRLAEKGGAFDFLNDPEEDIYTDHDLKVRYND
ncbi:MAG: hypothetical protein ACE5HO_21030 [bacterium]